MNDRCLSSIAKVKDNMDALQKELKSLSETKTNIESAIKELREKKKVTIHNIYTIQGALQAFQASLKLMEEGQKEDEKDVEPE